MGVMVTRIVKFILKGAKGDDAVRYWLIPSVSSVSMKNIESGDGTPTPSSVSVRLVKQVGDDSPTTIATPSSAGLTISYALMRTGTNAAVKSYTGAVSIPTNTDYYALEFYLYRGSTLIDTVTVSIIPDGEDGQPGQPGKDGVSYSIVLSPSSVAINADGLVICESDSINAVAYKNVGGVTSEANDGSMRLYFTKADGTTSNVAATGLTAEGVGNYQAVWFEYTVNSKVVASTALVINREGQTGPQGDRGPALRGPQAWSDCAVGYKFQSGAKGDEYKDVVLYDGNYYSCINSHTKTASNYPGSASDETNKYWRLGQQIELVATKILLATYALVKNLGVEAIDMKDANGNILFQAKDGNVTCNTGNFKNIHISGNSTFRGFIFREKFIVTSSNYSQITKQVMVGSWENEDQYYTLLDLEKTGNWIEVKSLPSNYSQAYFAWLPSIRVGLAYTDAYRDYVRQFMGNEIVIYNSCAKTLGIDTGENSVSIGRDMACRFKMVFAAEKMGNSDILLERVKWEWCEPFQF